MRLETFLVEYKEEGRTKQLKFSEALKMARTKCKKSVNRYLKDSAAFYRGHVSVQHNWAFVQPSKFSRVSANTDNYYTLWIDNSPKWSKYPKRSESLIGSTSTGGMYGGNKYIVFPFDNAQIGVVPDRDFWSGFDYALGSMDLSEFNDYFARLLRLNDINPNDIEGYRDLISAIEVMDMTWSEMSRDEQFEFKEDNYNNWFVRQLFDGNSIKETFDKTLDPKPNGFKTVRPDKIERGDNEVWTNADCLMIDYNMIQGRYAEAQWQFFVDEFIK